MVDEWDSDFHVSSPAFSEYRCCIGQELRGCVGAGCRDCSAGDAACLAPDRGCCRAVAGQLSAEKRPNTVYSEPSATGVAVRVTVFTPRVKTSADEPSGAGTGAPTRPSSVRVVL